MKIILVLALIAYASAKEFKVQDADNKTCVLLNVDGTVTLSALQGTKVAIKTLKFDDAKVLNTSTCTEIQLDLTDSAQVWFQLGTKGSEQEVTPISTFDPKTLFGDKVNDTESPVFAAKAFGSFSKNESFTCHSSVEHVFELKTNGSTEYNFTVAATTSGLQIQFGSIENDTFSDGPECSQDVTTSSTPATTPSTPSTTPVPSPKTHDFNVTSDNKTCIKVESGFQMSIDYMDGKEKKTFVANVPDSAIADGDCNATSNSSNIQIKFDPNVGSQWVLEYTFEQNDKSSYHVAQIALTYKLPKDASAKTVTYNADSSYLKATTKGYYTCNAKQTKALSDDVKLTTKDFKYKAFNDEPTIDFSGDVAECSADEETNSVVPIAVGAALAGLVVIVLIAYLIGRRRSRKSGYESV